MGNRVPGYALGVHTPTPSLKLLFLEAVDPVRDSMSGWSFQGLIVYFRKELNGHTTTHLASDYRNSQDPLMFQAFHVKGSCPEE